MKKKICFSLTRGWVYLFELPLAALFSVCILYHDKVSTPFKLFPLEILIGGVMIFFPIYFFRVLTVAIDEAREIGPFSSRDGAMLTEGRTLVLKKLPRGKFRLEIFGGAGEETALPWVKQESDRATEDYRMFHSTAIGGKRAICRVLSLYGIPDKDCEKLLKSKHQFANDDLTAVSEEENEQFTVRVRFSKTML